MFTILTMVTIEYVSVDILTHTIIWKMLDVNIVIV